MAPPWSIWAEQTDSLSQRDTGWIQLYASNSQEVYDLVFIAFRLAESSLTPVMICMDGFLLTHTKEPVEVFDNEIDEFISYKPEREILDVDNPKAFGALAFPKDYMPIRLKQHERILGSIDKFKSIAEEFGSISNRYYKPVYQYGDENAKLAIVVSGSIAETAHLSVDALNKEGIPSKLVKMTMFRPFPKEDLKEAFEGVDKIVVFDRNISMGKGGIFKDEIVGALGLDNVIGVVCGLGGYDVNDVDIKEAAKAVFEGKIKQDTILWGER